MAVQAKVVRSIMEHCGDIVRALVTGAAAEPDLELVLAEGHRRHVEGARRIVGLLQELDALDDPSPPKRRSTPSARPRMSLRPAAPRRLRLVARGNRGLGHHHQPHTAARPPVSSTAFRGADRTRLRPPQDYPVSSPPLTGA